jgi:hypothetical protein
MPGGRGTGFGHVCGTNGKAGREWIGEGEVEIIADSILSRFGYLENRY